MSTLEAAIGSEPHHNVQTTTIPAGGASIVEFKVDVPENILSLTTLWPGWTEALGAL